MPKIDIEKIAPRIGSGYPAPFHERSQRREKRALGDAAGLSQFGVNLVRLPPGEWSSQRHWHSDEDEFVYVLEGELTLVTDEGRAPLRAGECAGFAKGVPDGHHLVNDSARDALYLEVGARAQTDDCSYPDIDLKVSNADEIYRRKDGRPYPKR
jgi:uncharacterized cupin superfamily protein